MKVGFATHDLRSVNAGFHDANFFVIYGVDTDCTECLRAVPVDDGWLKTLAASDSVADDETILCEQVVLATEADFNDGRAEQVSLLTMYAAKGLEFPVVFVVGLEEG